MRNDDGISTEKPGEQRQARKEAAALASDLFTRENDRHMATYKHEMTTFEAAEAAITAKEKAEAEFGVRISVSIDVQGKWWFQ